MIMRHLQTSFFREAEGGNGGGAPAPEPQTFSLEYVKELRAENANWRRLSNDHRTAADAAKATADRATADATAAIEAAKAEHATKAQTAITEAQTKANERVIRAELRAGAVKAGMVDLDALKMLDASSLKLTDAGDVEGVDALLAATKIAKPYLFGASSTSSTTTPPPAKTPVAKLAKDMTDAEFAVAERNMAWRNK